MEQLHAHDYDQDVTETGPQNMTPKVQTCAQHKNAIWLLLLASALSNGAMEIGSACEANGKSGNGVSPSG